MNINARCVAHGYYCCMPSDSASPVVGLLKSGCLDDLGGVALLDDPLEWETFGHPVNASRQNSLPTPEKNNHESVVWESYVVLDGLYCATCALAIEDALKKVQGVQSADVNGAARRAKVQWDPHHTRPSEWIAAIERAGYRALPARDEHARVLRKAESRRMLWRWLVAGFCMMQVMMYAWPEYGVFSRDLDAEMRSLLRWASWVISIPVMLFACGPFFRNAWRDIRTASISMDLPVALGMLITFVVSSMGTFDPDGPFGKEVFYDSLTMFVFFLLSGRWLELRMRDSTAGVLEAVMNRLPDSVERKADDGSWQWVAVRRLRVGDVVRVKVGEAFPADGCILQGDTSADESLLTGESIPVPKHQGDEVIAGAFNLSSVVEVKVQHVGSQTRFAQIVDMMAQASLSKPRLAQLADRVAKPFLIVVLLCALAAGMYWWSLDRAHAVMVAVAILIVTCPCALSLATPVAMLSAAGALAKRGVLVRNLQALETLANVDTLIFDKTGTLTDDRLQITNTCVYDSASQVFCEQLAALLSQHSTHPVSRALAQMACDPAGCIRGWQVLQIEEVCGAGLLATVLDADGQIHEYKLGSASFVQAPQVAADQSCVFLAEVNKQGASALLAHFVLKECVRAEAAAAVALLQSVGVEVQLLSGDLKHAALSVANQLAIAQVEGECTPESKLKRLRDLQSQGRHVAMVGDGLNDGPVLAGACVSFAFGNAVPLARNQSDFVVIGSDLLQVPKTLSHARKTMHIVRQNLVWAAAYNAICVPLALFGWMPAWLAGLGMAVSSLLVVLNAARLSRGSIAFQSVSTVQTSPGERGSLRKLRNARSMLQDVS